MTLTETGIHREIEPLESLRILVSVSNREGIVEFIQGLEELIPVEVVATSGTAKHLTEAGIKATTVEEITDFPYLLDGRVKMIHSQIFLAILADHDNPEHIKQLEEHNIKPFDMVVVNLYPFEETVQSGADLEEVVEKIDVGGPASLRAGAKNFQSVVVVCDPKDYSQVLEMLKGQGNLSAKQRRHLARKAFKLTRDHDKAIIDYFSGL